MELKDIIAIGLGIWGAGLSSILAVREFVKDRRSLRIQVEYMVPEKTSRLSVANTGQRPVTIVGIEAHIRQGKTWQRNKRALANSPGNGPLPVTLADSEHVGYMLHWDLSAAFCRNRRWVRLRIIDSDGRVHSRARVTLNPELWPPTPPP